VLRWRLDGGHRFDTEGFFGDVMRLSAAASHRRTRGLLGRDFLEARPIFIFETALADEVAQFKVGWNQARLETHVFKAV